MERLSQNLVELDEREISAVAMIEITKDTRKLPKTSGTFSPNLFRSTLRRVGFTEPSIRTTNMSSGCRILGFIRLELVRWCGAIE